MIYTYDILLNWTKEERLKEFYEWNLEDDLEHIKKMPIIRIRESLLKDLLTSKVKIDKTFLSKIKYKSESYFHNEIDVIDYAVIVTTEKKALALELDNEGNIMYKSSLLIDEEEEVLEIGEDLVVMDIPYEVISKTNNISYLTRKEEEERRFLTKEIKKIKQNKEKSKLNYLYKEFFIDDVESFNDKLTILEKEISKDYNSFHHKLYNLLKLTTIKKK